MGPNPKWDPYYRKLQFRVFFGILQGFSPGAPVGPVGLLGPVGLDHPGEAMENFKTKLQAQTVSYGTNGVTVT